MKMMKIENVNEMIFGFVIGDALGVPFKNKDQEECECDGFIGYGTHCQEPGTWSDDTALMLCVLNALNLKKKSVNKQKVLTNMLSWFEKGKYALDKNVFDVSPTIENELKCAKGLKKYIAQKTTDCDNGGLTRCLPVAIAGKKNLSKNIASATSQTHNCELSYACCLMYTMMLILLEKGYSEWYALAKAKNEVKKAFKNDENVMKKFERMFTNDFMFTYSSNDDEVYNTLESAVYCLLSTKSFEDAVLFAVSLGGATDTRAAIAGSLAVLAYGKDQFYEDCYLKLRGVGLIHQVASTALQTGWW